MMLMESMLTLFSTTSFIFINIFPTSIICHSIFHSSNKYGHHASYLKNVEQKNDLEESVDNGSQLEYSSHLEPFPKVTNGLPIDEAYIRNIRNVLEDKDNVDDINGRRRFKRALNLLTGLLGSSSGGGGGGGGASADSAEGGAGGGGLNLGSLLGLIGPILSSSSGGGGGGGEGSDSNESGQDGGGGLGSLLALVGPLISSSSGGGGGDDGENGGGGGGSDFSSILSVSTGLSNSGGGKGQKKRELGDKQHR